MHVTTYRNSFVNFAKSLQKKYTTASCDTCDYYQLCILLAIKNEAPKINFSHILIKNRISNIRSRGPDRTRVEPIPACHEQKESNLLIQIGEVCRQKGAPKRSYSVLKQQRSILFLRNVQILMRKG